MFFRNDSSNSVIHSYRSTGRRAPVGSDYDSKLAENLYFPVKNNFLVKILLAELVTLGIISLPLSVKVLRN